MSTELEKLLKKKERILKDLDKVYEQIALEKLKLENTCDHVKDIKPDDNEKKLRNKFRIT